MANVRFLGLIRAIPAIGIAIVMLASCSQRPAVGRESVIFACETLLSAAEECYDQLRYTEAMILAAKAREIASESASYLEEHEIKSIEDHAFDLENRAMGARIGDPE